MSVAEPRREPAARRARRLHGEGEDLRIRRLRVLAAEAFKAGLGALPALPGLGAKDRPEIGILRDPAGVRRGQIGPADRNRIFGAEAKLLARGVGGQEQPAANLLARHVEKDRRRVEDRRLEPHEAGAEEMLERPLSGACGGLDGGMEWGRLHRIVLKSSDFL